jgi:hypothetical protein
MYWTHGIYRGIYLIFSTGEMRIFNWPPQGARFTFGIPLSENCFRTLGNTSAVKMNKIEGLNNRKCVTFSYLAFATYLSCGYLTLSCSVKIMLFHFMVLDGEVEQPHTNTSKYQFYIFLSLHLYNCRWWKSKIDSSKMCSYRIFMKRNFESIKSHNYVDICR